MKRGRSFVLAAWVVGAAVPAAAAPFDRTLELQGIRFHVTQAGETLTIAPSGLEIDNSPLERKVAGTVTGAAVADLNADGSPEIYVYVGSPQGGAALVAFSANRRKSLSEIFLPPLAGKAARGYRGRDEIAVAGNRVVRRFPVYRPGDADGRPTGGTRQVRYRLAQGEASWVLKAER